MDRLKIIEKWTNNIYDSIKIKLQIFLMIIFLQSYYFHICLSFKCLFKKSLLAKFCIIIAIKNCCWNYLLVFESLNHFGKFLSSINSFTGNKERFVHNRPFVSCDLFYPTQILWICTKTSSWKGFLLVYVQSFIPFSQTFVDHQRPSKF